MKKKAKFTGNSDIGYAEASELLTQAYSKYREVIKESAAKGTTFIHDLAVAKAKEGKSKVATVLKQMLDREKVRDMWGRIHRMDGTARSALGLTKVYAPDEDGTLRECNQKFDIEKGCLEENERRFTRWLKTEVIALVDLNKIG